MPALAAHPGPTYMRLLRGKVPTVLDEYDYRFELGKAAELRTGRDVVLISTGLMTMRALTAAERLEADHVDVAVLHVPTIKPSTRRPSAGRRHRPAHRHYGKPHHHGRPRRIRGRHTGLRWKARRIAHPSPCPTSSSPALHPPCTTAMDFTDEVIARIKLELGATAHGHGPWVADDEPPTA